MSIYLTIIINNGHSPAVKVKGHCLIISGESNIKHLISLTQVVIIDSNINAEYIISDIHW